MIIQKYRHPGYTERHQHQILFLLLAGFILLMTSSCDFPSNESLFSDPIFENPTAHKYEKGPSTSAYAYFGWLALKEYHDEISKGYRYSYNLIRAQFHFDLCWQFDPDNYNAYWGWAIIRKEQALLVQDQEKAEQYLQDSIRYLKTALKMNTLPAEERIPLELDLANTYHGLKNTESFETAHEILERLLQQYPEDGRIYQIYSFNAFYRRDYKKANEYRKKAESLGIAFPKEYLYLQEWQL